MRMLRHVDELLRQWGSNIKRGRKLLNLTQSALAERVGVEQPTVARWEAGRRAPSDRHKVLVATELHQDVHQLFPLVRAVVA